MEATAIHELLKRRFGDDVLDFVDGHGQGARVAAARVAEIAQVLRDEDELDFESLMCLTGLDWDGYDESGKGKSVGILGYDELGKPETSDRVGEGELGVAYALYSHRHGHKFCLYARVPRQAPEVPSVSRVWPTAAWHEREAFDLVGVRFTGHPDLRRILLDDDWAGHPLRKDYQMPGVWQEVPLAGRSYAESKWGEDDVVLPDPGGDSGGGA
ncbi:NADH-quinone oxidoreductase subunit C [bacterium]|nr:NADH-quinone oxidoreductase subunit C [bacterium]MBU1072528.1 NADH-quinone oxidoreductase subunit C [bacterium]MBU1674600.1 NADH-quinone oxidoreductase subunit C [bacterium]